MKRWVEELGALQSHGYWVFHLMYLSWHLTVTSKTFKNFSEKLVRLQNLHKGNSKKLSSKTGIFGAFRWADSICKLQANTEVVRSWKKWDLLFHTFTKSFHFCEIIAVYYSNLQYAVHVVKCCVEVLWSFGFFFFQMLKYAKFYSWLKQTQLL